MDENSFHETIEKIGVIADVIQVITVVIGIYFVISGIWITQTHLKTSNYSGGIYQSSKYGFKGIFARMVFGYVMISVYTFINLFRNTFGFNPEQPEASLAIDSSLSEIPANDWTHIAGSGWMSITMVIVIIGATKVGGLYGYMRSFQVFALSGETGAEQRGNTAKKGLVFLIGAFFLYNAIEIIGLARG